MNDAMMYQAMSDELAKIAQDDEEGFRAIGAPARALGGGLAGAGAGALLGVPAAIYQGVKHRNWGAAGRALALAAGSGGLVGGGLAAALPMKARIEFKRDTGASPVNHPPEAAYYPHSSDY